MGVMLDKIQFVLVFITFSELMWLSPWLNSDTMQKKKIPGFKFFNYISEKKNITAFDGFGMHLSKSEIH